MVNKTKTKQNVDLVALAFAMQDLQTLYNLLPLYPEIQEDIKKLINKLENIK